MTDQTEQTLWQGTYSSKALMSAWILSVVLFLVCSIAGLLLVDGWMVHGAITLLSLSPLAYFLLLAWYRSFTLYYAITTRRLVCRSGLINLDISRVALMAITDISCSQRGLDRAFGIGAITVQSTDTSDPVFTMRGIENVQAVLGILDQACTLERANATKVNV